MCIWRILVFTTISFVDKFGAKDGSSQATIGVILLGNNFQQNENFREKFCNIKIA